LLWITATTARGKNPAHPDSPGDLDVPGYGLHQLSGDLAGFWAVKVDKNYRIVFRFDGVNMQDVDYLNYH
jgi:proteic killer suppression protein